MLMLKPSLLLRRRLLPALLLRRWLLPALLNRLLGHRVSRLLLGG